MPETPTYPSFAEDYPTENEHYLSLPISRRCPELHFNTVFEDGKWGTWGMR